MKCINLICDVSKINYKYNQMPCNLCIWNFPGIFREYWGEDHVRTPYIHIYMYGMGNGANVARMSIKEWLFAAAPQQDSQSLSHSATQPSRAEPSRAEREGHCLRLRLLVLVLVLVPVPVYRFRSGSFLSLLPPAFPEEHT
jgi:hypothetical protein